MTNPGLRRRALLLVLGACLAGAAPGCRISVRHEASAPRNYDDWPAPTVGQDEDDGLVVEIEPPPRRHEVVTGCPGPDFCWVDGCWTWRDGWDWRSGRWVRGRPGHSWRSGVWITHDRGWCWSGGGWVRHR